MEQKKYWETIVHDCEKLLLTIEAILISHGIFIVANSVPVQMDNWKENCLLNNFCIIIAIRWIVKICSSSKYRLII